MFARGISNHTFVIPDSKIVDTTKFTHENERTAPKINEASEIIKFEISS